MELKLGWTWIYCGPEGTQDWWWIWSLHQSQPGHLLHACVIYWHHLLLMLPLKLSELSSTAVSCTLHCSSPDRRAWITVSRASQSRNMCNYCQAEGVQKTFLPQLTPPITAGSILGLYEAVPPHPRSRTEKLQHQKVQISKVNQYC